MLAAIVTHFETPAETGACLRALDASARPLDRVIVVDNGSAQRFSCEGADIIRSEINLGFAGGCNLGIRRALTEGAHLILLVNSDAEVTAGCVGELERVLAERPEVGIAAPVTLRRGPPARVESMGVRFSRRSGRMINLGAGQLERAPGGAVEVEAVTACCALIRREVFDRVGLFADELFYGFEDLDLCLRAAHAGFGIVCQPAARLWHLGARSIGEASPDRLYFATRNHLRVAGSAAPLPPLRSAARALAIVGYNLAHALFTSRAPAPAGLRAVAHGAYDHLRGRYGRRSAT